jgi:hypothetical protein
LSFNYQNQTRTFQPANFTEVKDDLAWWAAIEQELKAVEQNRTWELVPLPAGHRPITLKWVYKLKKDELGAMIKHKARLVARGFVQQERVDYDDAFAPVVRMESVRVLLTLAAQEGWRIHHMDVKSAFLNGDLEKEVYMQQGAPRTPSWMPHSRRWASSKALTRRQCTDGAVDALSCSSVSMLMT